MTASFTTVGSLVVAALNAAGTYTAVPSDPRFYTTQIQDACNNADGLVVEAICSNRSHPRRQGFLTSSIVANGALVPSHIGPIEGVVIDGKGSEPWPVTEIENERLNPLSLISYNKHYWIDGSNLFFHNGTSATVHYAAYTRSLANPPVLQSPDEYTDVIVAGAMTMLATPEGEDAPFANHYQQQFLAMLAAIRENREPIELTLWKQTNLATTG